MPAPYSLDLRNRVIAYIQGGGPKVQACKLFMSVETPYIGG